MRDLGKNKIHNIVWFKRDLRLHDHKPLYDSAHSGPVIPLYVIEPELWQQPDASRRHWHFIQDSLLDLNKNLQMMGGKLIIRTGDILNVFGSLKDQLGAIKIWSHEETGNHWTFMRDMGVLKWCKENNVTWIESPSNGVVRKLGSRDGWSKIRDERMAQPVFEKPKSIEFLDDIYTENIPDKDDPLFGSPVSGTTQTGGRVEGIKTLESFLRERSKKYMLTISKPGISARYCSRLSPHIAYGTLSVREIEQATKRKITTLRDLNDPDSEFFSKNLSSFLSRLAWRCHFVQKLEQQPSIEMECIHPAFEGMREPFFRQDYFEAWKTGNTGYPLIDACMRGLIEDGWITFRMRAMLVSFASYHLWLDWRHTAPYLAKLFTDYEPGIHYSQFQMQSGVTGINSIRMYNPLKQSIDQDPDGKFIRRYVSELKNVPNSFIHEPWRYHEIPSRYPRPIVEHHVAIKHARGEISKRWKTDGFKEESRAINKKLGSRNRPPQRQLKTKKAQKDQFVLDL